MNAPQDLNRLYSDVSDSIASAMADILDLNVEHKDGKRELGNMTETLRGIQARFDGELVQLKTHAEWDMFTMAFFGETNAGKSTIIESLRILFKEESRQALLEEHAHDLEKFESALADHIERLREGLNAVYAEYAAEITAINHAVGKLSQILLDEATARNRIAGAEADARAQCAEQEASVRLKAEQEESAQRLRLAQEQANSSIKTKLILFATGGLIFGAATAAVLMKLAGA